MDYAPATTSGYVEVPADGYKAGDAFKDETPGVTVAPIGEKCSVSATIRELSMATSTFKD